MEGHIGRQPCAAWLFTQDDHRFLNGRVLGQGRFDLAQFNAEATQLYLLVDPP